jgi:HK97 family phage major capsid protein
LAVSLNQLALSNYQADYIMLNPTDFTKILLLKDSTTNYIKEAVYSGIAPSFNGVPVIVNTAIAAGTFLVGNFGMGSQLWTRENLSVSFHREDGTNVRDGFVTVRVAERIALSNYAPLAFVSGSFATAKAALETV